jgi:hypothetical protein
MKRIFTVTSSRKNSGLYRTRNADTFEKRGAIIMKKFVTGLSVFAAFAWASQAEAVIGCSGPVANVELRATGLVIADWGFGPIDVCYLSADTAMPSTTVKKEACQAIYSQFLTAYAMHENIRSYHASSTTCSQAMPANGNDHMPAEQPYGYHFGS